ncbi:ATP-dependent RNA helicase SUV3-like protein, mitochondrial [Armadillidium vulgare]|nr:ATP-dependent RNA helicase SUV3-like protein, mitochondrial [Armadillidium vulgare]
MNRNLILKFGKLSYGLSTANMGNCLLQSHHLTKSFVISKQMKLRKNIELNLYRYFSTNSRGNFVLLNSKHLPTTFIIPRGFTSTTNNFGSDDKDKLSQLFLPVEYEISNLEESLGDDLVGPLKKEEIIPIINKLYNDVEIKELASEQGIDQYLFRQTINVGHIHDLYPYVYKHAKDIFPHLNCMDDLYKISDLSQPPNWYPEARKMDRKIIYHAGPTNSGKTYHAMEQYLAAESGIYCGPLKLLAVEVFEKSNSRGTSCDLVTGEERRYAVCEDFPASHVSCTVEMTSLTSTYDVAIIDEIQMIKDPLRGWAWTRALLGICAKEVHICGEDSAIELVRGLAMSTGEDFEVNRYKRLTPLHVEEKALLHLNKIQPGDCFVCFGRQMIHKISQAIEGLGHEVAVIYGGLPPGAKLAQAKKFNDPDHPCKVMVATDAIGMGLNLSIRRIIFTSLVKPNVNENGEKEMETISVSSALQIAGRAGRYNTEYPEGYVTTLKSQDLPVLQQLLSSSPPEIEQAGLQPTADQIELFAFHLPNYTLSNLLDIFVKICTVDDSCYFMCTTEDFKFLADLIQHISLPLRTRYIFCCSPINKKMPFICAVFLKFAREYSKNEPINLNWLCQQVKWPFGIPKNLQELIHLEEVFDLFDLYLWLSYRFPDMFPDAEMVRSLQQELDMIIQLGVTHITQQLKINSEKEFRQSEQKESVSSKRTIDTLQLFNQSNKRNTKRSQKLAEILINQGIISKKMLKDLHSEWKEMENENDLGDIINNSKSPKKKK